jgi:hypothetical protein
MDAQFALGEVLASTPQLPVADRICKGHGRPDRKEPTLRSIWDEGTLLKQCWSLREFVELPVHVYRQEDDVCDDGDDAPAYRQPWQIERWEDKRVLGVLLTF